MKNLLYLIVLSTLLYANSAFEKALLADEAGDFEKTIEYLFEALENPGEDEIEIRILLNDYLEVLGDQRLVEQNKKILFALMEEKERGEVEVVQEAKPEKPKGFWGQNFSMVHEYSKKPWGEDSLGYSTRLYTPELNYNLEYFRTGESVSQMWNLELAYSKDVWQVEEEYSQTEGVYEEVTTDVGSLEAYTFTPSLGLMFFNNRWTAGLSYEGYHSNEINWASGVLAFGVVNFWMEKSYRFNLTGFVSMQEEFADYYSVILGYSHNFNKNTLRFGLNYSFDFIDEELQKTEAELNYYDYTGEMAIDYYDTLKNAVAYQGEFLHNLQATMRWRPVPSWKLKASFKYSVGQKVGTDEWYRVKEGHESVDITNTGALANLYYDGKAYLVDGSYFDENTQSFNYENFLERTEKTIGLQKWRLDLSTAYEIHEDGWLRLRYLMTKEISDVESQDLVDHLNYSGSTNPDQYVELEYSIDF